MRIIQSLTLALALTSLTAAAQLGPTNPPANVILAWDPSPSTNVVKYRVYYGIASGTYTNFVEVGAVTNATVTNLVRGTTYFFAATAKDTNGLESDFSNEVNYRPPTKPGPPATLRLTMNANGALILGVDGEAYVSYSIQRIDTLGDTTYMATTKKSVFTFLGLAKPKMVLTPYSTLGWQDIGSVATNGKGAFQFLDPMPLPQIAFYRAHQI